MRRAGTAAAPCPCRGRRDAGPPRRAQAAGPAPTTTTTRLPSGIGGRARDGHAPPAAAAATASGQPAEAAAEAEQINTAQDKKFGCRYLERRIIAVHLPDQRRRARARRAARRSAPFSGRKRSRGGGTGELPFASGASGVPFYRSHCCNSGEHTQNS
jgi:hypothetical protein